VLSAVLFAAILLAQVAMPVMGGAPMAVPDGNPSDGITVSGSGSVAAQATSAQLTLRVGSRNNTVQFSEQTLQPIVDALVSSGIDRRDIAIPIYVLGVPRTNAATIIATIRNPSVQLFQNGQQQLTAAFARNPDLMLVGPANVRLDVANCEAFARQAQSAAIRQGLSNAQDVARSLGVHIGSVQSAIARSYSINTDGTCSSVYTVDGYNFTFTSPADYLRVRILANVTLRYAIRR
jgi:hypothetical protein